MHCRVLGVSRSNIRERKVRASLQKPTDFATKSTFD
jgi:hypothetical protein